MSDAATHSDDDWLSHRVSEVKADGALRAKVAAVRQAVADRAFAGEMTTPADIERLRSEL